MKICTFGRSSTELLDAVGLVFTQISRHQNWKLCHWNSICLLEKLFKSVHITSTNAKSLGSADGSSDENLVFFPRTDTPEAPIISGMLAATEGQLVSMNCSVNYHCPSRPPSLQWIWERGDQLNITQPVEIQTVFAEPNRPVMLASLSFTVSHQVKPRLRCEASYPGASALATSKELHVTCEQIWLLFDTVYVINSPHFHF